jgi:hypothetical protein
VTSTESKVPKKEEETQRCDQKEEEGEERRSRTQVGLQEFVSMLLEIGDRNHRHSVQIRLLCVCSRPRKHVTANLLLRARSAAIKRKKSVAWRPLKPRLQGSGSQQPRKLHHSLITTQQQQQDPRCSLSLSSPPKHLKTVNKNPDPPSTTNKEAYI